MGTSSRSRTSRAAGPLATRSPRTAWCSSETSSPDRPRATRRPTTTSTARGSATPDSSPRAPTTLRCVIGTGRLQDGTPWIVLQSENDASIKIRELKEMDKILEESEEALKASLHDEAPPRERKPLGLIGFSLKLEGSGDKKYGIQ